MTGDSIFDRALVADADGRPIHQPGKTSSQDWDEVQDFCRRVYMPYRVRPLGQGAPDATMRMARVGGITVTVDGQQQQVATGTTAADLYKGQREVVVARIDGTLRDLATPLADGGAPILLRTEMDGGHGGASGRYQGWEDTAWEYAFLLTALGATARID